MNSCCSHKQLLDFQKTKTFILTRLIDFLQIRRTCEHEDGDDDDDNNGGDDPYHDRALLAVVLVELDHVLEGEVADDVAVEDEEGGRIFQQDISCQGQRAGCEYRSEKKINRPQQTPNNWEACVTVINVFFISNKFLLK